MTAEESLDWAERNPGFYEFYAGQIVAMSGPTREHEAAVANLVTAIRTHPRGTSPCRVFGNGLAVRVEANDRIHYPDVHVTCHPEDRTARRETRHPALILEVLSPSTRDYDQGDKFRTYKLLQSLREYVVIDTAEQAVTLYRRGHGRHWGSDDFGPGETGRSPTT